MKSIHRALRPARGALALAALLACAGPSPGEPVIPRGRDSRVLLVLPLNVASRMPPELESRSTLVWKELQGYLRRHSKELKTVSWRAARILWLRSLRELRAAEHAKRVGYDDAARAFARDLRSRADFDTLIAPSLFVRKAPISFRTARWDGVEREIEIEARGEAVRSVAGPLEGVAPAVSLHVAVFDERGDKLHEATGGLELMVRFDAAIREPSGVTHIGFAPRTDLFADRACVREGIGAAFVPFLPPLRE